MSTDTESVVSELKQRLEMAAKVNQPVAVQPRATQTPEQADSAGSDAAAPPEPGTNTPATRSATADASPAGSVSKSSPAAPPVSQPTPDAMSAQSQAMARLSQAQNALAASQKQTAGSTAAEDASKPRQKQPSVPVKNTRPTAPQPAASQPTTGHLDKFVKTLEVLITMQEARTNEERASFDAINERLQEIEDLLERNSGKLDAMSTGAPAAAAGFAGTETVAPAGSVNAADATSPAVETFASPSPVETENTTGATNEPEKQTDNSLLESASLLEPDTSASTSKSANDDGEASPASFLAGGTITDWDSQKRSILAEYGFEGDDSGLVSSRALKKPVEATPDAAPEKSTDSTPEAVASPEAEPTAEAGSAKPEESRSPEAPVSDAEVAALKEQLRQKIREAEVELSIKRTKLEQREAKIEEQTAALQHFERQRNAPEPESVEDGMLGRLKKHLQAFSKPKDGENG